VIGNNARTRFLGGTTAAAATPGQVTDPGALFYTSANAAVTAISGQPVIGTSVAASDAGAVTTRSATAKLPDTANKIDYTLGVTGRSAGATYDVVYLSVVMDLDPAYLFKFIDQLYKQNMCYTVVNMQARAVDPLDRASNGYLYGDSQVIEVELLVECILFRSWTEPLMPDQEKLALGGTPGG